MKYFLILILLNSIPAYSAEALLPIIIEEISVEAGSYSKIYNNQLFISHYDEFGYDKDISVVGFELRTPTTIIQGMQDSHFVAENDDYYVYSENLRRLNASPLKVVEKDSGNVISSIRLSQGASFGFIRDDVLYLVQSGRGIISRVRSMLLAKFSFPELKFISEERIIGNGNYTLWNDNYVSLASNAIAIYDQEFSLIQTLPLLSDLVNNLQCDKSNPVVIQESVYFVGRCGQLFQYNIRTNDISKIFDFDYTSYSLATNGSQLYVIPRNSYLFEAEELRAFILDVPDVSILREFEASANLSVIKENILMTYERTDHNEGKVIFFDIEPLNNSN